MRKLALLTLLVLLASTAHAAYYADSIEALGYNATFSGIHLGSTSQDNYISTSPTGTGNATLYIGNARIITEGMSLNPAGGWYDNGGVVALETPSDNIIVGTASSTSKIHVQGENASFYSGTGIQALTTGRDSAQNIELYVTDSTGYIRYNQDEVSGVAHNLIINTNSPTTDSQADIILQTQGVEKLRIPRTGDISITGNLAVTGTVDGYDISTYGPYFIDSAGTSGQVWKSDGTGRGYWTTDNVNDADASTTNEIQTLGTSGNTITLTNGGSVTAPYATNAGTLDGIDSASFLRSDASDTMDAGTSTDLTIRSDDTGESTLSLHGDSQGTGRVFVGQSSTYGGGIEYNGDGNPASSGSTDHFSIFRRSAGTDVSVLHWVHNSNTAYFEGDIDLKNNALVNVDWSTSDHGTGSGLDADLLDGQNGAYYLDNTDSQTLGTSGNTITLTNGGSVTAPYATNAGTLDGIDSTSFLRSDTPDTLTSTLKVTGGLIHEGNSAIGYVAQPGGGFYQTTSGSVTGAVQVCLPTHGPADMVKFVVDIFDYTTSESVTAYIAGYAYQGTTGNSWVNPTATVVSANSAKDYTVRFGGDGSNNCVWIGETSSTWAYPQVVVRDFMGGYNTDIDQYDDGWRVDVVTTLGTVDETVSNNFPYSDWNRMKNIPAGFADGVDADSYPGDLFVNTNGDTMSGTLNMNGNTISGANSIQSSGDNIDFFSNRADDTSYEWMGWYSGATRKAILIYDGNWDSCAADTTVCFKAEASNSLHLKSDSNLYQEGTNVVVMIG